MDGLLLGKVNFNHNMIYPEFKWFFLVWFFLLKGFLYLRLLKPEGTWPRASPKGAILGKEKRSAIASQMRLK
jgi:hypothetical protein